MNLAVDATAATLLDADFNEAEVLKHEHKFPLIYMMAKFKDIVRMKVTNVTSGHSGFTLTVLLNEMYNVFCISPPSPSKCLWNDPDLIHSHH